MASRSAAVDPGVAAGLTALDITGGLTEYSSRLSLKGLFGQFGEVTACWMPPAGTRSTDLAFVKFATSLAAEQAMAAGRNGALQLDGIKVTTAWRGLSDADATALLAANDRSPSRSQSSSRSRKKSKKDKKRDKKRKKSRSYSRKRKKSRSSSKKRKKSRSSSRKRKKSRSSSSSSRSRSRSRSRSSSRSRSRSRRRDKDKKSRKDSRPAFQEELMMRNSRGGGRSIMDFDAKGSNLMSARDLMRADMNRQSEKKKKKEEKKRMKKEKKAMKMRAA